jgi:hypothetical protein
MSELVKPDYGHHVACDICLKEIPQSEAQIEEASDYVIYFCGLDCYEKWRETDSEDMKE